MEKRTSGKAIATMVCGILSIFLPIIGLILGTLAIVFGVLVKNETKQWQGIGLTGFICGIIGVIENIIIIIIILFVIKILRTYPFYYYLTLW